MPIQAPQWTEFLSCPVCYNAFDVSVRSPISLGCGHTICKACLSNLHRKQCPFDQTSISIDIDSLPINTALLQLVGTTGRNNNDETAPASPVDNKIVPKESLVHYLAAKKCVEELAMYLKPFSSGNANSGTLSRPMQRKLVTLINCQLVEDEGRTRAMRAARSLGERTVTELILQHQNPQQLSANLWAAVRARGCQFLGPAMQEEVLKLVLLALEDGSALSRKVLVMFVVQRLEPHFPQASKTSIGHVVQLLYRASCFKVSKREGDSSLMQLKEEFRTYEALRREHDAQIVQIATEAGLRIAPDQWSALLYGDTAHKSHMQSIMDKLQTPQSFAQSVQELVIALQRTGDPGKLSKLRPHLELLAAIDPSPESTSPSWKECSEALNAVKQVVAGLVEFIHQHGSRKLQDPTHGQHTKYKISMCRDLTLRGSCPRGSNCTFAHSAEELEKFRAKNRKIINRATPSIKDHRIETQSPVDKAYTQSEDFYHIPNTTPVPSVPIQTVVPIARMNYDVPYSPTYPPTSNYAAPQPIYPPSPGTFPPEVFGSATPNMVFTNGGQFYATQPEYGTTPINQSVDYPRRPNWEHMINKQSNFQQISKNKCTTTSLAELHQRKQEVISQLEKVFGKNAATAISNNASTLARQDSFEHDSPYSFWTGHVNSGPTFVRSDSILKDDEYVPYDAPCISKFGPISRMQKENNNSSQNVISTQFRDNAITTSMVHGPVSTPSPVTSWYYSSGQPYHQTTIPAGHPYVTSSGAGLGDGYYTIGSPQLILQRMQDPSKELLAESQRVKMQLLNLEKQLNDLKLATQGVTSLSEGERLTQELQLIEQGIQEKQKEACLNKIVSSLNQAMNGMNHHHHHHHYHHQNGSSTLGMTEEAMYEEDIANDMRELELRWQEELEEQEKRWSSEDDSTNNFIGTRSRL
ncbi:roquin-1 [Agrilus planipennis]|uniref:RING-type E3 ubiquitin transferase n=1 Tax=Agrilus planipennis TaxID=224129 RepID=A0A1W4XRU0_AGRPL|nr:roquin-1 [Agrilus planipennis]